MGKFDHVAILTDLDGTFLSSTSGIVTRNVEAIEYFKSEGGRFALATGRMHYNLDRLIPNVERLTNAPSILCNGTYLYDFATDRVISENYMEPASSLDAAFFIHENFSDVCIRVSRREGYLIFEGDEFSLGELHGYGIDTYEVKAPRDWDGERWYKAVCSGKPERLNEAETALMQAFPEVFEYNRSRATTLELQMRGTNKASLLNAFRSYLADMGETRRVYMCGDYENDRAILSAADVAICPRNALPEIKAICHDCLGSNDEGVIADLVEKLSRE